MDSAVTSVGSVSAWVRSLLGLMVLLAACPHAAPAQGPAPAYEKKSSWAETLVALRTQALGQPQLFRVQPRGWPQRPGNRSEEPPHPLVACWTHLEQDFPLECDWMLQDLAACGYPCSSPTLANQYPVRWFGPWADADLERKLILRVVEELGERGEQFQSRAARLSQAGAPPHGRRWLELYVAACRLRRDMRLRTLAVTCPGFVFTKHFNMGGSHYTFTEGLSDAQSERHFEPGSSLCLCELAEGVPTVRTLLSDPSGVIRDPDVAYEGDRVLLAWKKSDRLDDYHLYELDLASGKTRQLTFGLGFADYEGAYLPSGDLLFNSTRCVQAVDCFFTEVSNLYTCDRDGRFLRRLAFDQVHSNFPTLTEDGRVLYTRWEYNDRGQIYTQALFQMNPDGTAQTECYGNNSYFPTAILHARQIPGTQKVLAIAAGHHTRQTGKLIMFDPERAREENHGAQLVAPLRRTAAVRVDAYGQQGELWQYPYPLSDTEFLASYSAWGWARAPLVFGLYYATIDGRRELLVSDPLVSCNQPVPLRRLTPHRRPNATDYAKSTGTFYIQNVYSGPGLTGVPRGAAKRLRVIALDFRATVVGGNHNRGEAGEAFVATPIAVAQGSWEAKTIVGETPIQDDGSAFFIAPARTPLYFQVLDDKGHMIQTMRSWATLQPGENASCVGCHEHKGASPLAADTSAALRDGPQPLEPFYGPPRGFSFAREIQPILDRHCTNCHNDRSSLPWLTGASRHSLVAVQPDHDPQTAFSLLSTSTTDRVAKRRFSDAYLALTGAVRGYDQSLEGTSRPMVNWTSPQSGPPMRAPYSAGSATSGLMTLLEQGHRGVALDGEELDKLACWIDLVVPYCGDYVEANAWGPFERARYEHFLRKRKAMQEAETRHIRQLLASRGAMQEETPAEDDEADASVSLTAQVVGADGRVVVQKQAAGAPRMPLVLALPRALQEGDCVRVSGHQHLAVQLDPQASECLIHVPAGHMEWTVPTANSRGDGGTMPGDAAGISSSPLRVAIRPAAPAELSAYRNLAANPYDSPATDTVFPHASASSQRGADPLSAAQSAIDTVGPTDGCGGWRGEPSDEKDGPQPWWQVDFGRVVEVDKVVLMVRPDKPGNGCWRRATLVFSDGYRRTIDLQKTDQPQTFTFDARRTSSLRVTDFVLSATPGDGALSEVEVWGRDRIPLAEDLAME
jgi:hypothetical protein